MTNNKNLKSLEDYNKEALNKRIQLFDYSHLLNGIACPECGNELHDWRTNTPTIGQREVICRNCGYEGFRYV
jgi:predicted RNA-binding Zn-ribbon protein involved in translation (DUF1610 family)